jgi:DegV family protein with EDD domain
MHRLKTPHHPQIGYLDGNRFQYAILSGCKEIIKHEKELNKLNVFPIPDKDTGANLKKTLIHLVEKYPFPEPEIKLISQEMADLAVQSALGYSGIIFSQIFLGFAEAVTNHHRIYPGDLKSIIPNAVKKAYQSVEEPVEGTILTVLREWSEEVSRICSKSRDFAHILEVSYQRALSTLQNTPNQLEVLRKNKVVDAGGQAFVYFLEGILDFVKKGKRARISSDRTYSRDNVIQDRTNAPFCAECCVKAHNLNRKDLLKKLSAIGQDFIFYGDAHFAKLHINTHNPDDIFSCTSLFGEVSSKRIFRFSSDPSDREKQPYCLAADSTCDLMNDIVANNNVYFIPIKVQAGNTIYTDRWNLIPEEFYQILDASPSLPKTSQPGLMDFTRIYRHLLNHYQSIISVHLSKALSGTYQTAVQASLSVDPERISVVDGKNISVGLGLVLLEGIRAIKEGKKQKETLRLLKAAARETQIFIGLPTLKYLVKGGRITKTKGIIANILNINPILSISEEGKLIPVSKARGIKSLEEKIFDLAYERAQKTSGKFAIAVAHTNAPDTGERISQRIKKVFGKDAVLVMNASPALGAHAGPGAFGIALGKMGDHSLSESDDNLNT